MSTFRLPSILVLVLFYSTCAHGGALQITSSNIDTILSSYEVVFINFYANWCRFSQMLDPIFNEFADKVAKEFPTEGVVAIGKVDCEADNPIAVKYHINKYPTLKLYRHGLLTKREYRGARQVDAFLEYIRKHIESAMVKIATPGDLAALGSKKRYIVGHLDSDGSENYKTFSKVASLLRDDCTFVVSTNRDEFKNERPSNDVVYYRPPESLRERETYYTGPIDEQEALLTWSREKCVPLVREITFANAEELTDEGLPFLILFHKSDDSESVAVFEREVAKQLLNERSSINCLHADAAQFTHPLQHLGKTVNDLPLLAIDSFKHMFLFPDISQMATDGKLLEFVKDLHSGKLHRDFHNPTTTTTPTTTAPVVADEGESKGAHIPKTSSSSTGDLAHAKSGAFRSSSDPPDSVFARLLPNRQRYSFRDEL